MADIRPFRAIRPGADMAERIASLPYDVYSRREAYELVGKDRHSFLRIDRPETQFGPEYDMYSPEVYEKASEMLEAQIRSGEFVQDEAPAMYVYSQTMDGRTQTGIAALASVSDYTDGVIKKHENTRSEKEEDRVRHIDACNAQTGPIFLAYRGSETISGITGRIMQSEPLYDFVKEGVRQRVWIIDDPKDISSISDAFGSMDSLYIADGHHRCASAVRVALNRRRDPAVPEDTEAEHFLSVLFPDDELMIMDYNRVILSFGNVSRDELFERISENFDMRESDSRVKPEHKGVFGLYTGERWYRLEAHKDVYTGDPVKDLDVAVLQDRILGPVLGITDPKTDNRIDFVGGIRGLDELEKRCRTDAAAAFSMYPTDIHELFAVADAGRLMPPKSTWFEPKLLSGLFIHDIKERKGKI